MLNFATFVMLAATLPPSNAILTNRLLAETETRPTVPPPPNCGKVPIAVRVAGTDIGIRFGDISFRKHNFSLIISIPNLSPSDIVEFRSNEALLVTVNEEAYRLNIGWKNSVQNSFAEKLCSKYVPQRSDGQLIGSSKNENIYWTSSDQLERLGVRNSSILTDKQFWRIGSVSDNSFKSFLSVPRKPITVSHVDSIHGPLVTVDTLTVSREAQSFHWDRFTFSKRDIN